MLNPLVVPSPAAQGYGAAGDLGLGQMTVDQLREELRKRKKLRSQSATNAGAPLDMSGMGPAANDLLGF